MKLRLLPVSIIAIVCVFSAVESIAAACEPDGVVKFMCGPVSPEDLAAIPQSPWIIASGMENDGYLYLIDSRDGTLLQVLTSPPDRHFYVHGVFHSSGDWFYTTENDTAEAGRAGRGRAGGDDQQLDRGARRWLARR